MVLEEHREEWPENSRARPAADRTGQPLGKPGHGGRADAAGRAPSACGLLSEQKGLVSKLKLWSWVPGWLCSFNKLF